MSKDRFGPNGERLVTCTTLEAPESEYCGAAEAVMMCASR